MPSTPVPSSTQNVYVGARYIPKYFGEWDATTVYEPLSMVLYNDDLYISVLPVAAGITPANNEYWVQFSAASPDLTALTEQVNANTTQLTTVDTQIKQLQAYNTALNNKVSLNTEHIATNTADIATNTADIATNTADIASLKASGGSGGGAWKLASAYGILPEDTTASAKINEVSPMSDANIIFPAGQYYITEDTTIAVPCMMCPGAFFQFKSSSAVLTFEAELIAPSVQIFSNLGPYGVQQVKLGALPNDTINGSWFGGIEGEEVLAIAGQRCETYPTTLLWSNLFTIQSNASLDQYVEANTRLYPLTIDFNYCSVVPNITPTTNGILMSSTEFFKITIRNLYVALNQAPDDSKDGFTPLLQCVYENANVEFENVHCHYVALVSVPFSTTGHLTDFTSMVAHNVFGFEDIPLMPIGKGRQPGSFTMYNDEKSSTLAAFLMNGWTSSPATGETISVSALTGDFTNIRFNLDYRDNTVYTFNKGHYLNCDFDIGSASTIALSCGSSPTMVPIFEQCSFHPSIDLYPNSEAMTFINCVWENKSLSRMAVLGTLNGELSNKSSETWGWTLKSTNSSNTSVQLNCYGTINLARTSYGSNLSYFYLALPGHLKDNYPASSAYALAMASNGGSEMTLENIYETGTTVPVTLFVFKVSLSSSRAYAIDIQLFDDADNVLEKTIFLQAT